MNRIGNTGHLSIFGVIDIHLQTSGKDLRVTKDSVQGIDWTTWNSRLFHDLSPIVDGPLSGDGAQGLGEFVPVENSIPVA